MSVKEVLELLEVRRNNLKGVNVFQVDVNLDEVRNELRLLRLYW